LDLLKFTLTSDGFSCTIKLKPLVDPRQRECNFNNATNAGNYELGEGQTSLNSG